MTKQILVDVSLPINKVSKSYVTVLDDDKGLVKTILLKQLHSQKQAEEIVKIAQQYNVPVVKIDTRGIGLGVFEYIIDKYHTKKSNRKTGYIELSSYNSIEVNEKKIDESYLKVDNYIQKAIEEVVSIQKESKQGSLQYVRALKTQLELERLKLNLAENNANTIESVVIECGEFD